MSDYYHLFEQRLDIQQTFHYWESDIWERGRDIVKANIGKVFEESEGAVVFPGEKIRTPHTSISNQKWNTNLRSKRTWA